MPLTERQHDALDVLDWLFDPEARRQGRSYILAVALIRAAAIHPNVDVPVLDHHPTLFYADRILDLICHLARADYRLRDHLIVHSRGPSIRLTLAEPVIDWLPIDDLSEEELAMRVIQAQEGEEPSPEPLPERRTAWWERITD